MSDEEVGMSGFKVNINKPRFYEREVPEINQLVMVKVTRVAETSAYVQLLEYSDIEGMILFSEVSTRRIRSMLKEIRVGQAAVCLVLRVDKEKGYIDLSRRRVNAEERAKCIKAYAQSKLVQSVLRQLSASHKVPMDTLCKQISWPLYRKNTHALEAFKEYINDKDESIFADLNMDEQIAKEMYQIIERKLTPQAIKLKAKIEVCCYEMDGIDAVKAALMAGLGDAPQEKDGMGQIQIKVVAPPHYEVITQSVGKEAGVKVIEAALERIESKIKEFGGKFLVQAKPEVLDAVDDEIIDKDVESDGEDDSGSGSESEQDETMGKFVIDGE